MTKQELSSKIAKRIGIEATAVKSILDEAADQIIKAMMQGENYYQRGFGTFAVITRKAKTGRNITKGTSVHIPEHKCPKFKPCKDFKDAVK